MTSTLSPLRHQANISRRRLSSFGEHLPGQEDFRNSMYSRDRKPSCGSIRSLASLNTDDGSSSTCTEHISNTVGAREKRRKERRRFRSFTKILITFLEKKNPTVCKNARNVILRYKAEKMNTTKKGQPYSSCGEEEEGYESLCESIKVPLKETVGSTYWRQAKGYLIQIEETSAGEQQDSNDETGRTVVCEDCDFEPLSIDSSTNHFTDSQAEDLSRFFIYDKNLQGSRPCNENRLVEERKLRKQRFWMLVRVLMRDVEENDSELYKKARSVVEDCAKRNFVKEERFVDLGASVQRELKRAVGIIYWKRAKRHLAKYLLKKANEKVFEDVLAKEASSFGSLDDDFPTHALETQPILPCSSLQQAACFPPPKYNPSRWRDPSIPTDVAIPTKRCREREWTTSPYSYYHSPTQLSDKFERSYCHEEPPTPTHTLNDPETTRKRCKV